tara:strand:+ start:261 stop:638 length:378 start_codon:yes stop_codon:yes gene_type:complete
MKKILLLLLIVFILFIYGCGKEEVIEQEEPGKITAYTYKIDEIAVEEEPEEEKEIKTVKLCHDTDNGIVRWESGQVFGFYDNASRYEFDDYCQNFNWLWEFYCENEEPQQRHFLCKNGCEDNHCL